MESGGTASMIGKILTFYLGGSLCGIDVTCVQEINRKIEYTPLPGDETHIVGLLNLRGQVVTLFDLAQILNFKQTAADRGKHCIILKNDLHISDHSGFFVDKLGDVIDVTPERCQPPPANISNWEGRFVVEVVKLAAELILVLDIKKIVAAA